MLEKIPTNEELHLVMGEEKYKMWSDINDFIKKNYNMDALWDTGGNTGKYELKYRKSGRTLCAIYPREQGLCILIIFGKAEREKFESSRMEFTQYINDFYDNTRQYHDGKWMYIDLLNDENVEDIKKLIRIKRKPNRKR